MSSKYFPHRETFYGASQTKPEWAKTSPTSQTRSVTVKHNSISPQMWSRECLLNWESILQF